MNYETKRNVFGQLLNAYQNLIVKDIEIPDENYRENIATPWNIVYDDALPDNLPVIPKAVGDVIVKLKHKKFSLSGAMSYAAAVSLFSWMTFEHEEYFARAWLLGAWRVEETGEIVKLEAEKNE